MDQRTKIKHITHYSCSERKWISTNVLLMKFNMKTVEYKFLKYSYLNVPINEEHRILLSRVTCYILGFKVNVFHHQIACHYSFIKTILILQT